MPRSGAEVLSYGAALAEGLGWCGGIRRFFCRQPVVFSVRCRGGWAVSGRGVSAAGGRRQCSVALPSGHEWLLCSVPAPLGQGVVLAGRSPARGGAVPPGRGTLSAAGTQRPDTGRRAPLHAGSETCALRGRPPPGTAPAAPTASVIAADQLPIQINDRVNLRL